MMSSRGMSHAIGTRLQSIAPLVLIFSCLVVADARGQSGYVGSDVCTTCHEDAAHAYDRTIHARVLTKSVAHTDRAARGCEACHGPGLDHVQSGGTGDPHPDWIAFDNSPPLEAGEGAQDPKQIERENDVCLSCHNRSRARLWSGSPHAMNDLKCTSCHATKNPSSRRHLLIAADQTTGCGSCHSTARAQQLRNRHMPVRSGPAGAGGEGWMDCSSCHNPHGTVTEALISANSVNESCYGCHAEKRGPFLWEHSPVNESCSNCHVPHGSIRPNMLRIAGPRLCQTCHIESLHPSQNRGPTDRFSVGQNCAHCHIKVHGSNHPSGNFLTR
jgi:DmsE family decaheme c-type cytochrome